VEDRPPWHLILVTSPALRAHITAALEQGHESDASTRPDEHGQGVSGALTRECLTDASRHLAVTYDRGRGGPVGLDRALGPFMDISRICWAIQNLWLAACAEGLGVEWIRLLDAGAVARLLALPPQGAAHRLSLPGDPPGIRRAAQTRSGGLACSETSRLAHLHGPLGADRRTSCGGHAPS
jgi:nitroreductase